MSTDCPQIETTDWNAKTSAYAYHLRKIHWSIFGCVDYASPAYRNINRTGLRIQAMQRILSGICQTFRLRTKNIWFFSSTEITEAGSAHNHFLIGFRRPPIHPTQTICDQINYDWKKVMKPRGRSRSGMGGIKVEPYDYSYGNGGVDYVTKWEFGERGQLDRQDYCNHALQKKLFLLSREES